VASFRLQSHYPQGKCRTQPERSLGGALEVAGQNGDEEKRHNARTEICSYGNAWSPIARSYVMWNAIHTCVAGRKFWYPPCCNERFYPLGLRTGRGDMWRIGYCRTTASYVTKLDALQEAGRCPPVVEIIASLRIRVMTIKIQTLLVTFTTAVWQYLLVGHLSAAVGKSGYTAVNDTMINELQKMRKEVVVA
jgi:hypothetical protein